MDNNTYLIDYNLSFKDTIAKMIANFFGFHASLIEGENELNEEDYIEAADTLTDWLKDYFKIISVNGENVGFVRMALRGGTVVWLEDIYVMPEYRKRGIATRAIKLSEAFAQEVLKAPALCIDVVPRNIEALKLYYKEGYDNISIITLRKEFGANKRNIKEKFLGFDFNI
ncbi:GNAT family N-acetyltransferase [Clostridium oryzae]|uniref:Acetyltransferase (GNAT) family protein n=1 Tax=Clostridium oryzae TaxID=1450648 RepID=A0A1V4I9T3_9CLOT|nr:GNAT family N-acetyltransferase [Clostridium oryzae]OPJ56640.1 acetyltransferase (GNAT) family protein [Clostridium oryzae]